MPEVDTKPHITDCGAARLLGAILEQDPDNIKRIMGLPTTKHPCPICGTLTKRQYCSSECYYKSLKVKVTCAECGKLFEKSTKKMIWLTNHNHPATGKPLQRFFCSAECRGSYAGKHYGFTAHPENCRGHILRKKRTEKCQTQRRT